MQPACNERGRKDTVRAKPDEVIWIKAFLDIPGKCLWHCHILPDEDHEMMRPYCVGNLSACMSTPMSMP